MTDQHPIILITGAPASGKSSVAKAILTYFEFGIHIPVDTIREFVVSGIAHPVAWSDETARQFRLAEQATCQMADIYSGADFAVVIDHCEAPGVLNDMVENRLADWDVLKVVLQPSLEENLMRNYSRSNKDFESSVLVESIKRLNPMFRSNSDDFNDWHRLDNSEWTVAQTAARVIKLLERQA